MLSGFFIDFFRYLASGDSYYRLAGRFRVSTAAVSDAVYQVCDAIYGVMQPMYMRDPTETDWMRIERKFAKRWHFPNCIGAIDGKHVCMKKPDNSSSVSTTTKATVLWY